LKPASENVGPAHPRGRWSCDAIVAAIGDWRAQTGNWPTVVDWTPSEAERWGRWDALILYSTGRYPAASSVKHHFGRWDAALRAAGRHGTSRRYKRFDDARTRRWSKKDIIDAIRTWERRYDQPPSYQEWNPSMATRRARPDMAELWYSGYWPEASCVARTFGSWSKAIEAAGFAPRSPGGGAY
jgi:hypothetical protein